MIIRKRLVNTRPAMAYRSYRLSELYERQPDYTVILAWVHAQKIIESNRKYLRRADASSFSVPKHGSLDKKARLLFEREGVCGFADGLAA